MDNKIRHIRALGRTKAVKPAMKECYWCVSISLIIDDGFFYQWQAFTNDDCEVRFKQDKRSKNRGFLYSRTLEDCRNNWISFAKKNDFIYYDFLDHRNYIDLFSYAKHDLVPLSNGTTAKTGHQIRIEDNISAICNEYNELLNYLHYASNFGVTFAIHETSKSQRIAEMKKDGRWKRMKELEWIIKDLKYEKVNHYDNQEQLHKYCPERYPLEKKEK